MNERARSPEHDTRVAQSVRVRPARPDDAATLAGFNRAMARETEGRELDPGAVRAEVAAVIDDPGLGFYAVAEESGRVLGAMLVTSEWSDWRNARFWWLQSVYVVPEARRRGVYRALHGFVAARAREQGGVCGLRLYVEKDNRAAQRTYRATGMRESAYRLFEEEF